MRKVSSISCASAMKKMNVACPLFRVDLENQKMNGECIVYLSLEQVSDLRDIWTWIYNLF